MVHRLVLENNITEIRKLADLNGIITEELELSPILAASIDMALEEAVSNVIFHAYPDRETHKITVEAETVADELIFRVIDGGIAFDPTLHAEADITLSADQRPIGGLGIFLIRQVMDKVDYERVNGTNVLTLTKKIKTHKLQ